VLWFVVLILGIAMLALCGQPQTTFAVGSLLFAFYVYRWFKYRRSIWLVTGIVLGIGLSLFQSLPFLEYLQRSEAQETRNAYNVFYLPLYQLITLLLPDF